MRFGMLQPFAVTLHLRLSMGQIGHTTLGQANINIGFGRQFTPNILRFSHNRNFIWITPLLADPAPVAAGLLARDTALFQQDNALTSLSQKQRGAHTDDATTNNHNIRRARWRTCICDWSRQRDRKRSHKKTLSTAAMPIS